MENAEGTSLLCPVCKEYINSVDHNASVNHRFHFMKWAYNEYRKALLKDRHGIAIEVKEEVRNNFHFDFKDITSRGKYSVKVTPEQLLLHDKTVTFNCKIKNTRRDSIYVTNINLLHSSPYFKIIHTYNYVQDTGMVLQLEPGKYYTFQVVFTTQILTPASYKIPLSCDFQTKDNKVPNKELEKDLDKDSDSFTIVRTFLIIIDDQNEERGQKKKSPFTSKPFSDVKTTVPTTKELNYTDHYPIPVKYMKLLKYGLEPFDNMTSAEEHNLRELKEILIQLTRENYNKFWHIVLWMEERAQALMLMRYNMEEVAIELKDDVLILDVPGLAEKRPSVIVGDFIRIRISGDHTAYKGFVNRVNDATVEISHVNSELLDFISNDPDIKLDVSFTLSRLALERMHHGVDRVVATGMVKNLFPTLHLSRDDTIHNLHDSDFYNQSIIHNSEQKEAVIKILNSVQPVPYIVFGPPGTGKTITIVEAILQIKKFTKKRILVCAPANSACDYIALKLTPHCTPDELIRIHSSTRDRSTITEQLKEYSNIEDDEFTKVELGKIGSCRIVITTLTLIGKFTRGYIPDCVFVDEAAQASEPETDIAIALLASGKQVVLAGDPKQLGPMATDCAAKFGLGISLLERLMQYQIYQPNSNRTYNSSFITMLKLNFRSHPDILLIPNQLFYDNNLEARSAAARLDPIVKIAIYPKIRKNYVRFRNQKKQSSGEKPGRAIEFYSLSSKEKREGSSPSYFNIMEAKMVVKYVKALMQLNLDGDYKVALDQIGVVTPYKRQVFKIKEGLRFNGFEGVEVGTTESFQGREKRIIIISTVRAQHALLLHDKKYNLGFVKHDQRFNVAVTRAISKLIVIGCPLVLTRDNKWGMYMTLCKEHNTYFGDQLENADDEFKQEVIKRMRCFQKQDDQYNH